MRFADFALWALTRMHAGSTALNLGKAQRRVCRHLERHG